MVAYPGSGYPSACSTSSQRHTLRIVLVLAAALTAAVLPLENARSGSTNHHLEDFTTTVWRDSQATTAAWDTLAGELRMPPYRPHWITQFHPGGTPHEVVIEGRTAFVAAGGAGLLLIDVGHSGAPTVLSTCDTPGEAWDVDVDGDYAYVADGSAGLTVVDVSDLGAPFVAGSLATPGEARGVEVTGDLLCLAATSHFHTICVADPTSPFNYGGPWSVPGEALDVALRGDLCAVACGSGGIMLADVTHPSGVSALAYHDSPGTARRVAFSGSQLFLADGEAGVSVLDTSDPASPALLGSVAVGEAMDVTVAGPWVYTAVDGFGIVTIDAADPTTLEVSARFLLGGGASGLALDADRLYAASSLRGLDFFEVAELQLPEFSGESSDTLTSYDMVLDGHYAYTAILGPSDDPRDLCVYDIADPASPVLIATYSDMQSRSGLCLWGDKLLMGADYGIDVFDISDPHQPQREQHWQLGGTALEIEIAGDDAYVSLGDTLLVVDIEDLSNPQVIASIPANYVIRDLEVEGDHLYVCDNYISAIPGDVSGGSIRIIDISFPSLPSEVGSIASWANPIVVFGNELLGVVFNPNPWSWYSTTPGRLYDVTDPLAAVLEGSFTLNGSWSSRRLLVQRNRTFIGAVDTHDPENSGLHTVDLSDPSDPTPVGVLPHHNPSVLQPWGDYLFSARGGSPALKSYRVLYRDVDTEDNQAQSLPLNEIPGTIRRVALTASWSDSIRWRVSADDGSNWQLVPPDGSWQTMASPGEAVRWQATLVYLDRDHFPSCPQVEVAWLYDFPLILSLADHPKDQGGWMDLRFSRSAREFDDESDPVVRYVIYRREELGGSLGKGDLTIAGFPPGTWTAIDTVLAARQDEYLVTVPTHGDSLGRNPPMTVYMVTGETGGFLPHFNFSPPDSGCSVDNLVPHPPQNLVVDYHYGSSEGNHLAWDAPDDPDVVSYRIYRSTLQPLPPNVGRLVAVTTSTEWTDAPLADPTPQPHYQVTAVDDANQESWPAYPSTVTDVPVPVSSTGPALHPIRPNPVSLPATIAFRIPPGGARIELQIHDLRGRRLRTLVTGTVPGGERTVSWDGRDDQGHPVASGVYFCRLRTEGRVWTERMVLMR